MTPTYSIILPFYKQCDHMDRVIQEYIDGLNAAGVSYELIIAINGESSALQEESMQVISEEPRIVRFVFRKPGWGYAIRRSFAEARGAYVCYTNTARTFVNELLKVLRYAAVSTSAVVKGARLTRENRVRKVISYFYNLENRLLLHTPVLDVNATPKVIPRVLLEGMPLMTDDEFFCAELMYRCYERNIPIIEVPILWAQRKGGRSTTNIKTALKLSLGLPLLRYRMYSSKPGPGSSPSGTQPFIRHDAQDT